MFLSVAAALMGLIGAAWLVAPQVLLDGWSMAADPAAVYMGRRYGGLFLGFAVIFGMTRGAPPSPARRAVLVGGAVAATTMAVLSVVGALSGVAGPKIWAVVGLEALLAGGFALHAAVSRA